MILESNVKKETLLIVMLLNAFQFEEMEGSMTLRNEKMATQMVEMVAIPAVK